MPGLGNSLRLRRQDPRYRRKGACTEPRRSPTRLLYPLPFLALGLSRRPPVRPLSTSMPMTTPWTWKMPVRLCFAWTLLKDLPRLSLSFCLSTFIGRSYRISPPFCTVSEYHYLLLSPSSHLLVGESCRFVFHTEATGLVFRRCRDVDVAWGLHIQK